MTRSDILKQIADAHYQLADLYLQLAGDTATAPASAAVPAAAPPAAAPASFADGTPVDEPFTEELVDFAVGRGHAVGSKAEYGEQGSLAVCPKHKVPYADGRYGPFCKQPSDEGPDWANAKGYCRITPKNAGAWLRQHAGAVA